MAIVFAIGIVPLVLLAGAALDYSRVSNAKVELDKIAGAAAIAALANRANADREAQKVFAAAAADPRRGVEISDVSVKLNKDATVASVAYKARLRAGLTSMIATWIPFNGSAEATSGTSVYTDVSFLIDNSLSMTRPIDPNVMPVYDGSGCTFACHTTEAVMLAQGVETRLKYLQQALKSFVSSLKKIENADGRLRFSAYTFSRFVTRKVQLTSNLTAISNAFDAIGFDLDTHLVDAMASMVQEIGTGGDGSKDRPFKHLLVVTDAGEHYKSPAPNADGIANFDDIAILLPAGIAPHCGTLKRNGVKISIVWIPTKKEAGTDQFMIDDTALSYSGLQTVLSDCSSGPDFFHLATDRNSVDGALQMLTRQIGGQTRISR